MMIIKLSISKLEMKRLLKMICSNALNLGFEPNIATLTLEHGKKFVLTKLHDDNKLILLNEPLCKALHYVAVTSKL